MPQTATDRLLRPLPRLQPNSGLPEFGHLLTGRSRIDPTSAGGTGRGHAKRLMRARSAPSPTLPRKRGGGHTECEERERTESATATSRRQQRAEAAGHDARADTRGAIDEALAREPSLEL